MPDIPLGGVSIEEKFLIGLPDPLPKASECWEWQGALASTGYGRICAYGKRFYVHRLAWELAAGRPLEGDQQVRHSCDNRRCVNAAHLLSGSFYDNMQDAIDRERFSRGTAHWNAKLTADNVRTIRQLASAGLRQRNIAELFHVSEGTVYDVVSYQTWRHVDPI